jgi:hypothetical protein
MSAAVQINLVSTLLAVHHCLPARFFTAVAR